MHIDERIEALTQSVELLAHMQQDEMKVFREETTAFQEEMKLLGSRVDQIAQLVLIHETRLKDLETGQQ